MQVFDLHQEVCLLKVFVMVMSVWIVDMNLGSSCPNRSVLSIILPSVIKLLDPGSGNRKEEARSLTPPGCCMWGHPHEARSLTPPGCCMWVAPLPKLRNLLLRYGEEEETRQKTGFRRVLLEDNEHKRRLVQQSGPSRRIRHGKVIVTAAADVLLSRLRKKSFGQESAKNKSRTIAPGAQERSRVMVLCHQKYPQFRPEPTFSAAC